MKLFKNFQTKKQLMEENIRLKAMLQRPPQLCTVERNVHKVKSSFTVQHEYRNMPEDVIKREIARGMVEYLMPLISYDFSDNENGEKVYYGSLYVANKE